MTTAYHTTKPAVIPWSCLQSPPISPPRSPTHPNRSQNKQQKTFAQALGNVCDIPFSQLPKPCIKGDDRSIKIPDDEYEAGLVDCKHNLQGRIIWPKGSSPIPVENLRNKLAVLWKAIDRWGVTSIGRGYYEFSFSSLEDMRRVRSIDSWNLSPGILKLFAWTKDFSPSIQQQSTTQVWIRILGLSQEYWRKKILFAIASGVGTLICTDNITSKSMLDRSFGHYARVLIDLNLNETLCHRILVERTGYAFFVDIEYENLSDLCTYCKCTGHYFEICKRKPVDLNGTVQRKLTKKGPAPQVYAPKKKQSPEIVNLVASSANNDDVLLENEVNEELERISRHTVDNISKSKSKSNMEVSGSSNEYVDDTIVVNGADAELENNDNNVEHEEIHVAADGTDGKSPNEDVPHDIVQKDINFLKESWANLANLEPNDDGICGNEQPEGAGLSVTNRSLSGRLDQIFYPNK